MTTIVLGPRPPELEAWLERRRRLGQDRRDEVWDGRYVVAPEPDARHGQVQIELALVLKRAAHRLGLHALPGFNLGGPDDFRCPDAGLLPGPLGVWHERAVLVVEVLSPDDATFDKLDFYTAHGVEELLVVDWRQRSIRVLALQDGQVERERSSVLDATITELEQEVDWPPVED